VGSIWAHKIKNYENQNKKKPNRKKSVLIITQPMYNSLDEKETTFLKQLNDLLQSLTESNENYKIIIKLHPIEEPSYYSNIISKFQQVELLSHSKSDTHDLIKNASLVILQNSTVTIDVVMLKQNLLFYCFEKNMVEPYQPFQKLFLELKEYNIRLSIKENIRESKKMVVISKEYSKWSEVGNLTKNFSEFLLSHL